MFFKFYSRDDNSKNVNSYYKSSHQLINYYLTKYLSSFSSIKIMAKKKNMIEI